MTAPCVRDIRFSMFVGDRLRRQLRHLQWLCLHNEVVRRRVFDAVIRGKLFELQQVSNRTQVVFSPSLEVSIELLQEDHPRLPGAKRLPGYLSLNLRHFFFSMRALQGDLRRLAQVVNTCPDAWDEVIDLIITQQLIVCSSSGITWHPNGVTLAHHWAFSCVAQQRLERFLNVVKVGPKLPAQRRLSSREAEPAPGTEEQPEVLVEAVAGIVDAAEGSRSTSDRMDAGQGLPEPERVVSGDRLGDQLSQLGHMGKQFLGGHVRHG